MALHPDEGTGRLATGNGVFPGPHLRSNLALMFTGAAGGGDYVVDENMHCRVLRPGHQEKGLIQQSQVGHVLQDGVGFIRNRVRNGRFQGVIDFTMLLGRTGDGGKIGGVGAAEGVMHADNTAATFYIGVESSLLGFTEEARVTFIDDDNISPFEVGSRGHMERALDDSATFSEQLTPIGEELGIVVLSGTVGFQARPDKDVHPVGILPRRLGHTTATTLRESRDSARDDQK